ncbi:RnfH family protein [Halomonas huangheensis]|uniref:UPF0125 protein BJB45_14960 n=2 Tax=Halomonas huangheensis TaxID=1178482 RepID=W1N6Q3_9GAMM|nr:RnfH family protein [Halomonas huangheensis]ALM51049.1 hypothetical protein AR456_01120 [Halomonas huangheensis]ERL51199.1 hypothetical protein BJB45_14960 [Halomonas huangheensis]
MVVDQPSGSLHIEVAYALPDRQHIVSLTVSPGTTATQAVAMSRLDLLFPEIPAATFSEAAIGVFGKTLRNPQQHVLHDGDRVEVYRPLKIDPKVARIARARKGQT